MHSLRGNQIETGLCRVLGEEFGTKAEINHNVRYQEVTGRAMAMRITSPFDPKETHRYVNPIQTLVSNGPIRAFAGLRYKTQDTNDVAFNH
jgi:hypothetical protein